MLPFLRSGNGLSYWLLSALTELAVVLPWTLISFSFSGTPQWREGLPGIWLYLLAYTAAYLWEKGGPARRSDSETSRLTMVGAMAVGLSVIYLIAFATLPASLRPASIFQANLAMWFMPSAAWLWYQGARNGVEGLLHSWVFLRFRWQVVALGAAVLLATLTGVAADQSVAVPLYWSILLLAVGGLMLLVVTREHSLRSGQRSLGEEGGGAKGLSRLINGAVLLLMLLTVAASYLVSVERLVAVVTRVTRPVAILAEWLWDVAFLLLGRWIFLVGLLVEPIIRWLTNRERPPEQPPDIQMEPGDMDLPDPEPWLDANLVAGYLKYALLIAALIALAVYIYRLKPKPWGVEVDPEEERIDLGFWDGLMSDLRGLFGRHPTAGTEVSRADEERLSERDPRMLFRRLQAWGAAVGRPRRGAETPSSYSHALTEVQSEVGSEAAVITAVYNQARYGAEPPVTELVDRAAEAVASLERKVTDN